MGLAPSTGGAPDAPVGTVTAAALMRVFLVVTVTASREWRLAALQGRMSPDGEDDSGQLESDVTNPVDHVSALLLALPIALRTGGRVVSLGCARRTKPCGSGAVA